MNSKRPRKNAKQKIEVTERDAKIVETLAQYGVPSDQIASIIGMSRTYLMKTYPDEIAMGKARGNAKIAQTLYSKGVDDRDTVALIFLAKIRLGWVNDKHLDHGPIIDIEIDEEQKYKNALDRLDQLRLEDGK